MTEEKYKEICKYLRDVTEASRWEGNVFTVGGSCRDAIMGREIHDVDLAVTVPDGGVKFAEWLFEKGLTYGEPVYFRRFSTSRLTLREFPEYEIEIVQTRREQYTDSNSRNPEVAFGTLEEDCYRRDLTINSLYQDIRSGEIIDFTGKGKDDIRDRVIRTPLNPEETFQDDPLRILRTIRFATRFGWRIPDDILDAMTRHAPRIKIIRKERRAAEFERMLTGPDPVRAMELLRRVGAIHTLLPELLHTFRKKIHIGTNIKLPTVWDVTMERLRVSKADPVHRYAALFSEMHRISIPYSDQKNGPDKSSRKNRRGRGRTAIVNTALRRLHYDRDFIKEVKDLLPPIKKESPSGDAHPSKKQKKKRKNDSNSHDATQK